MDIFKQYDTFKEKCAEFPYKLEENCFNTCKLICHPTAENVLISMCSDEEAHSNAIYICRMADMLLMSDDGEEWSTFNLADARSIAEQNGYIYLTDLFGESAFQSEDWMINGKNDTVIVSEAYMREKGKRYAPVTPLTNKVLHFKKYSGGFFWRPSAPGKIIQIDDKYIDGCFKDFFAVCTETLPDLSESETINFKLFDGEITIDSATTRIRTIERFFEKINEIVNALSETSEALDICGYKFSEIDFLLDVAAAALRNNGIELSKDQFADKYYSPVLNGEDTAEKLASLGVRCGSDDIDCIKLAFIEAIRAEYRDKIEYSAGDVGFYSENIRRLELDSIGGEEEKYLISELLSHRPADYRVFYYINTKYPEEAENAAAVAEFWQIAPLSEEDMENVVLGAYLLDENFDEQGRFCAGFEESRILKEQIGKVIVKYGLSNHEVIDELEQHIELLDKQRRTFNGTIFDTPEEMKLAVKNEAYVQELCTDLSALNEQELNALDEHIENTTLDANTKSKYKLKIKLAMNNVQSAMLEQQCLKLPIMSLDEIAALRKKLTEEDIPEAVMKPFTARIRDAVSSAQTAEIENMLKNSESMSGEELDAAADKLDSGRYDKTIAEYYKDKIGELKENNIKNELHKLTDGFEAFGKEKLASLIENLKESSFPKRLTMPLIHKVTDALNNYEQNEAAKTFEGVDIADEEQLERMKKVISDGLYSDDILAPYILRVEQREKELWDEKLTDMCKGIDSMSQEQLESLKKEITDPENNFDELLVSKYLDKITQRDCELKNSELAELCKYIFSMESRELEELKEKLGDEKYDKEFTDVYYRKIAEREQELLTLELDRLCAGIDDADMEVLEKLRTRILDDDRYADICDDYIAAINNRIEEVKADEYRKLIGDVAVMSAEEVDDFRKNAEDKRLEIGEKLYEQSMAAADAREDALETEAIVKICGNIESYGFEQAESVKAQLADGGFSPEKIAHYVERIDDRITELHVAELNSYIDGIENMNKEQLIQAQIKIGEYTSCPDYLREKYTRIVDSAAADIADREIREMCGDISSLSAKKSEDIIRRINNMPLDEKAKSKYVDALDAHIAALKETESNEYIRRLTSDMGDYGINAVHLSVPGMSNLFLAKYETACSTYVSVGRYELPILVHDGNSGDGFTMTTEYLYILNKGVMNRIKVDDIASFQAKKGFMASSLTVAEKNGNISELPTSLKKEVVDNVAKVLTALISFIHERRSAERMKELVEHAAQEKAAQSAAMTAAISTAEKPKTEHSAPEHYASEYTEDAEEEPAVSRIYSEPPAIAQSASALAFDEIAVPVVEGLNEDPENEPAHEPEPKPEPAPAPVPAAKEPVPVKEETAEVKIKFCDQCGARITSPTAKFCAECGNKLI